MSVVRQLLARSIDLLGSIWLLCLCTGWGFAPLLMVPACSVDDRALVVASEGAGLGTGGSPGSGGTTEGQSSAGAGGALPDGRDGATEGQSSARADGDALPDGRPAGVASPDAGREAGCIEATRRCQGTTPESCLGGAWQAGSTCPFVCTDGVCVGSCVPGTRRCSDRTPQRCTDTGQWQDDGVPCASVCTAGFCIGSCTPSSAQCTSSTQLQTCGTDGQWGAASTCLYACLSGACGGSCKPGTMQCSSSTQVQTCGTNAQWGAASSCTYVCAGTACGGVCVPGSMQCSSATQIQTCGNDGQWSAAAGCMFACANNACGGVCSPGSTRCTSTDGVQTCDVTGQWGTATSCINVCRNDQCSADRKIVFVTSALYTGNLGGLAGADAVCQRHANSAGVTGTFRAWLSDLTGSPSTRFTHGGPYQLRDNTVIANNWAQLTSGTLLHAISMTENSALPPAGNGLCTDLLGPHIVWSNTVESGSIYSAIGHCTNWSETSSVFSGWGTWFATTGWSVGCNGFDSAAQGCGSTNPLFCFQQ